MNHIKDFCPSLKQAVLGYVYYFPVVMGFLLLLLSSHQKQQLAEYQHTIAELTQVVDELKSQSEQEQLGVSDYGGGMQEVLSNAFRDMVYFLQSSKQGGFCVLELEKKPRLIRVAGQALSVESILLLIERLKLKLNQLSVKIHSIQVMNKVTFFTLKITTTNNEVKNDFEKLSVKVKKN